MTVEGLPYSVRERSPWKKTFDVTGILTLNAVTNMVEQWGLILAAAHSRADRDSSHSGIDWDFEGAVFKLIDGKHAEFRANAVRFVQAYSDQVQEDYKSFLSLRTLRAPALRSDRPL